MKPVFTAKEVKQREQYTIEQVGIPSLVLMEKAALFVCSRIENDSPKRILIVCGYGNNGADGLAITRLLHARGHYVSVIIVGKEEKATVENTQQRLILQQLGIMVDNNSKQFDGSEAYDIIIDAIFGIGLNRDLEGCFAEVIEKINKMRQKHHARVIAVDIPSGVHADKGCIMGSAVMADETVTFQWLKMGMFLGQGPKYCGEIITADIGIYDLQGEHCHYLLEDCDISRIPFRNPAGNKGTFGKVLSVTGSKDMAGAMILSTAAVFRSGAGMARIISNKMNKPVLFSAVPEAVFVEEDVFLSDKGNASEINEEKLKELFDWSTALLIGCGLSDSFFAQSITEYIMTHYEKPLVVDGDALRILKKHLDWLDYRKKKGYSTILTPHPLEFAGLCGTSVEEAKHQDIDYCMKWAEDKGCLLVAKDAVTLITDGKTLYFSNSGTDALATAGSGDVLAGIITAFICMKGESLLDKAALAVYVHGMTGRFAAKKYNHYSVKAGDLPDMIPEVLNQYGV